MANRATLILLCMLSVIQLTFVAGFQAMHMPVYSTAGNVRVSMHTRPLLLRSNRLLPRRAPATHSCNRPNKPSGREWHLRVTPEPGDQPPATVTITADGLKTKKNMNAYRKIFHAINGVALALLYEFFMSQAQAVLAFGLSFMVLTAVEVLRLKYAENTVSKFLFRRFRSIARDYETEQLSGMVYYMAGITIAVALFPKVVAVLAILFLGLGDPFASTVGKHRWATLVLKSICCWRATHRTPRMTSRCVVGPLQAKEEQQKEAGESVL
jgi:hypothetical protein